MTKTWKLSKSPSTERKAVVISIILYSNMNELLNYSLQHSLLSRTKILGKNYSNPSNREAEAARTL